MTLIKAHHRNRHSFKARHHSRLEGLIVIHHHNHPSFKALHHSHLRYHLIRVLHHIRLKATLIEVHHHHSFKVHHHSRLEDLITVPHHIRLIMILIRVHHHNHLIKYFIILGHIHFQDRRPINSFQHRTLNQILITHLIIDHLLIFGSLLINHDLIHDLIVINHRFIQYIGLLLISLQLIEKAHRVIDHQLQGCNHP